MVPSCSLSKETTKISGFPTRPYEFDDLRLVVGHRLQLDIPGRDEPVPARLLGYLKGATLIVKMASGRSSARPPLGEGGVLEVRGFSGRVAFTFKTLIEKIRYSPYAYCHLKFPDLIQGTEIRHAERVRVNLPVMVVGAGESDRSIEATIANISAAGAMLISPVTVGEVGDRVSLTFQFWLLPNDYEVNMRIGAIIRAVAPNAQGLPSELCYGVRFDELRSSEGILLQSLIYQRLQENPSAAI